MTGRRPMLSPWPFTPAVKSILVACGAIWLACVICVHWADFPTPYEVLRLEPNRVIGGLELWRLLTWIWVHDPDGLAHVLLNGLFLWMFGGALELAWGSRAFWRYYLTCGIGSGVAVLACSAIFGAETPVVGASGAVYGLVIAWVFINPERPVWLFGLFPIKGRHFALIPIGLALADFLLRAPGVSHVAHLGGMAIGALLITGYWRPGRLAARLRTWRLRRGLRVHEGGARGPQSGRTLHRVRDA
ncbi:MAG TPA: rhomboid family intramembrane serine protease [Polyangia bacterium]|nr:rhomboid family intramembrane serine protease [Polyangia bacterium]